MRENIISANIAAIEATNESIQRTVLNDYLEDVSLIDFGITLCLLLVFFLFVGFVCNSYNCGQ